MADADPFAAALTTVVCAIRAWPERAVSDAITRLVGNGHPLELVARAAIDAATTESTRTPAGIAARIRGEWAIDLTSAAKGETAHYGRAGCSGCGEHGHRRPDCPHTTRRPAVPPDLSTLRDTLAAHTQAQRDEAFERHRQAVEEVRKHAQETSEEAA